MQYFRPGGIYFAGDTMSFFHDLFFFAQDAQVTFAGIQVRPLTASPETEPYQPS